MSYVKHTSSLMSTSVFFCFSLSLPFCIYKWEYLLLSENRHFCVKRLETYCIKRSWNTMYYYYNLFSLSSPFLTLFLYTFSFSPPSSRFHHSFLYPPLSTLSSPLSLLKCPLVLSPSWIWQGEEGEPGAAGQVGLPGSPGRRGDDGPQGPGGIAGLQVTHALPLLTLLGRKWWHFLIDWRFFFVSLPYIE